MLNNIVYNLRNLQFKKVVYPLILGVFIALAAVVFVISIQFLYSAVNKALVIDAQFLESQLIKVDFDNFNYVMKKLERGVE